MQQKRQVLNSAFSTPGIIVEARFGEEEGQIFEKGERVYYIGSIRNMPGKIAVVDKQGKTFWGLDERSFYIIEEESQSHT